LAAFFAHRLCKAAATWASPWLFLFESTVCELEVPICDFKLVISTRFNRNAKSSGKRFALRFTAWFSALVVTPYKRAKSASNITRWRRTRMISGSISRVDFIVVKWPSAKPIFFNKISQLVYLKSQIVISRVVGLMPLCHRDLIFAA